MSKHDGGPAFPQQNHELHDGMSLRDWFAGMALQGCLAAGEYADYAAGTPAAWSSMHAERAYRLADAMLAARAAGGERE